MRIQKIIIGKDNELYHYNQYICDRFSCAKIQDHHNKDHTDTHTLPPGSNEMLCAAITAAPELEVIISDVIIPPGAGVPEHFHPGEEFVYILEGSAVHIEKGKPDQELHAGDTLIIEPGSIHAPPR